jgi:Bacterial PH domain
MTAMERTVLKHPWTAYLIAGFVALCETVLVRAPWQALIYLIPLVGICYVARTATIVDEHGLRARYLFGSRLVGWHELRGLRLDRSGSVYAVDLAGGQLRLPCVRSANLAPLVAAGAGRIPDPAAR